LIDLRFLSVSKKACDDCLQEHGRRKAQEAQQKVQAIRQKQERDDEERVLGLEQARRLNAEAKVRQF